MSPPPPQQQHEQRRRRLRYAVLDRPPLPQAVLLGFQQYLVMLGSTVLIPSIVVPPMGAGDGDLAAVICTIFLASGVVTLLQTWLGDRLPIVQGGSFAFISPALGERVWGWWWWLRFARLVGCAAG